MTCALTVVLGETQITGLYQCAFSNTFIISIVTVVNSIYPKLGTVSISTRLLIYAIIHSANHVAAVQCMKSCTYLIFSRELQLMLTNQTSEWGKIAQFSEYVQIFRCRTHVQQER